MLVAVGVGELVGVAVKVLVELGIGICAKRFVLVGAIELAVGETICI